MDIDLTAAKLNEVLSNRGFVQVTTYGRSTVYEKRHAGMFFDRNGDIYVKRGKSSDKLTSGDMALVGIRTGKFVKRLSAGGI